MNKQIKITLFAGILLIVLLLVWLFSSGEQHAGKGEKSNRTPYFSSNWNRQYQLTDKDPLGLYLFTSLASAHLKKGKEVRVIGGWDQLRTTIEQTPGEQTYAFVGNNFGLENNEIDSIIADIEQGSTLFMSFDDLMENVYPRLFNDYEFQLEYDEAINVFTGKKKYPMISLFENDTVARDWWAFGELEFDEEYQSLSSFMELPNFVKVPRGKGWMYLHATPNLFFNYQIKRKPGYEYTEFVLNQLPRNQDICMLELGRLADNTNDYDTDGMDRSDGKEDNSYLRIVFENRGLLSALLLSIAALIVFVIFQTRRTRPVVPYLPPKKDMTMAFAETITSIYFAKRNPYAILQVQRKNFYDTVHKFFFVDLYRKEDDRPIQILAEKSNTSKEEIVALINAYETKQASAVTEYHIAEIAKKQQKFYRESGIISAGIEERISQINMIFRRNLWLPSLLIVAGIGLIFAGLYFLVIAKGVGILMWPAGMIAMFIGILRLARPYLIVTDERITYYTPWATKREFHREELLSTEMNRRGIVLKFTNDRKLIINNWDMSRFDQRQFERFVTQLHNSGL